MSAITDVTVEKVGTRIHLHCAPPWEVPGMNAMVKRVPGANWSPTKNCWTYPLSMATCRSMRRVFDDMLVVGPELARWSIEATREENARRFLCHAKITRLRELPEYGDTYAELINSMRGYQKVGARYLAARPSVLADQPGLGKTLQYLASLVEGDRLAGTHIILAPALSLNTVWGPQSQRWLGLQVTTVTGSADRRRRILDGFWAEVAEYPAVEGYAHVLVINPEMLQVKTEKVMKNGKAVDVALPAKYQDILDHSWDTACIDEAQKYLLGIKNATRMTQAGRGLMALKAAHKTALTGTPMKGQPKKLWSLLHWLYPSQYRSYWQWVETYFEVTDNGFGKEISDDPQEAMRDHFYADLDTVMLRRTKGEVLKQLPAKQYNDEWVDCTPSQRKQYDDMLRGSEAKMGEQYVAATGVLAELTRLSQIASAEMTILPGSSKPTPTASSGKFLRLMEMLEERGVSPEPANSYGTNKFVVASQYVEVLDFLEQWFADNEIETIKIHGGVTGPRRTAAQQAFQSEGGARIMLINTATAQAIDLDAHCDEMFVLDETFVPDDQEQLEDRIHRASRIHQVTIHYLRTRDTIDQARMALVADKENVQKIILDGRRGVEFARKLITWKAN